MNNEKDELLVPLGTVNLELATTDKMRMQVAITRLNTYTMFLTKLLSYLNGISEKHYKTLKWPLMAEFKEQIQILQESREAIYSFIEVIELDKDKIIEELKDNGTEDPEFKK